MQRETVFCKSSHSPQGAAGKRGGAGQREPGETQRPGSKQGSPAPGSGPAPGSTSSPSSHPPCNCSSSSRAERGGIWVLRYPSRQCSLEMLTKDRREQSQLLSEEPVLPRWESPTVPSPTFSDFGKTWKLRCRETRRKEWAVPKPGAWLCDWQPGSAAPGRGWEVGGRQMESLLSHLWLSIASPIADLRPRVGPARVCFAFARAEAAGSRSSRCLPDRVRLPRGWDSRDNSLADVSRRARGGRSTPSGCHRPRPSSQPSPSPRRAIGRKSAGLERGVPGSLEGDESGAERLGVTGNAFLKYQ